MTPRAAAPGRREWFPASARCAFYCLQKEAVGFNTSYGRRLPKGLSCVLRPRYGAPNRSSPPSREFLPSSCNPDPPPGWVCSHPFPMGRRGVSMGHCGVGSAYGCLWGSVGWAQPRGVYRAVWGGLSPGVSMGQCGVGSAHGCLWGSVGWAQPSGVYGAVWGGLSPWLSMGQCGMLPGPHNAMGCRALFTRRPQIQISSRAPLSSRE